MADPKPPRTPDQRLAFIAGYMQAVMDVSGYGLGFARRVLTKMISLEVEPPPRRRRRRQR